MNPKEINLAHGSGGERTQSLIKGTILRYFKNRALAMLEDATPVEKIENLEAGGELVFTTDSFVVSPYIFPGGDIGKLAISGTVNDLASMAAKPLALSFAMVLEEGFPVEELEFILESASRTAREVPVEVLAGDTKVVEKGACDRIFINTSGIGLRSSRYKITASGARAGDTVIVTGTIGEHAAAILSRRKGLGLEHASLSSDCAPLWSLVRDALIEPGKLEMVHVMRDPTRGGIGVTLIEIAVASGVGIELEERNIPVSPAVRAVSDVLGLEPLYMASEGRLLIFCPAENAEEILESLRNHPSGEGAMIIGRVLDERPGRVWLKTDYGTRRPLDSSGADQLPRIC